MQATAQKPSASPKKKIGWGEGEVDKNEVTRWWLFLCFIIYLNIHKQAKSRHGKIETVMFIWVRKMQRLAWKSHL